MKINAKSMLELLVLYFNFYLEEKEVKTEEKEEDTLERTINFYMAKQG